MPALIPNGNGKDSHFPMDERPSSVSLVMDGIKCLWSTTQLPSHPSTWSSLLSTSLESLVISLQRMVHWARRSWNFSYSLVTRAWVWARGTWPCSLHRCTCSMDTWLFSQQLALHQNTGPYIFQVFSLFRLFTMELTACCAPSCCSPTMATLCSPATHPQFLLILRVLE